MTANRIFIKSGRIIFLSLSKNKKTKENAKFRVQTMIIILIIKYLMTREILEIYNGHNNKTIILYSNVIWHYIILLCYCNNVKTMETKTD